MSDGSSGTQKTCSIFFPFFKEAAVRISKHRGAEFLCKDARVSGKNVISSELRNTKCEIACPFICFGFCFVCVTMFAQMSFLLGLLIVNLLARFPLLPFLGS